jgi:cell division protein FtsZ
LIQHAAHEDANIIFGSVIDPNLSEEVRITVIATGFNQAVKTAGIAPGASATFVAPAPQTPTRRAQAASQITLPYDAGTQITKEYPPPTAPRRAQTAQIIDEPEIDIDWERPDTAETATIERALATLGEPVPEGELSAKLATGSGPAPVDGTPLVSPSERKRAQSRPSMKAVLSGEIDAESELDVPTFIRRHNAAQT